MKQLASLILIISLFACKDEPKQTHNTIPKEEITTIIYASNLNANEFKTSVAARVTRDTFMLSVVDSSGGKVVQEKKWVTDTIYAIRVQDTARDQSGKPHLDSAGNVALFQKWVLLNKILVVHDFNKVWQRN